MCEDNLSPYGVLDLNGSKGCREAEEDGREESKDKDSHALAAGVQVTRSSRVGAFIPLSPAGFNRQSTVLKVDMTLNYFLVCTKSGEIVTEQVNLLRRI